MIVGKYIGLRALEREDLSTLRDWRNKVEFRKNFREVRELSLADQESWFESLQKTKHINYMFVIIDLETNTPIGAAGLLYINWIIKSADFSFYIGGDDIYIDESPKCKEAVHLLLNYGFSNLNLNKIWMELYEFDSKKISFFMKNYKFLKDGVLRDNCFENGEFHNSYIISLLRRDFR